MADENEVRITLRLPESLRDRIAAASARNERSMNGEIVATLEDYYPDHMTIGEFFEAWVPKFAAQDDDSGRREVIAEANKAAAASGANFRVVEEEHKGQVVFLVRFTDSDMDNVKIAL